MTETRRDFEKIIASLDGDRELFAQIAGQISRHYADYADQIELLLKDNNQAGLYRQLHKLKASWALYVPEHADLPVQVDAAFRAGETQRAENLVRLLLEILRSVSRQLELWVK